MAPGLVIVVDISELMDVVGLQDLGLGGQEHLLIDSHIIVFSIHPNLIHFLQLPRKLDDRIVVKLANDRLGDNYLGPPAVNRPSGNGHCGIVMAVNVNVGVLGLEESALTSQLLSD